MIRPKIPNRLTRRVFDGLKVRVVSYQELLPIREQQLVDALEQIRDKDEEIERLRRAVQTRDEMLEGTISFEDAEEWLFELDEKIHEAKEVVEMLTGIRETLKHQVDLRQEESQPLLPVFKLGAWVRSSNGRAGVVEKFRINEASQHQAWVVFDAGAPGWVNLSALTTIRAGEKVGEA